MARRKANVDGGKPNVSGGRKGRTRWPFPRATLEQALKIAYEIKDHNGGNPWEPEEVRKAIGAGKGNAFFYLTAASRDYGLTIGTRDTDEISLAELGRNIVYAPDAQIERSLKEQAFLNVEIFKQVLEYYKGSNLPEMKYLGNTLQKEFGLDPETHDEFSRTFRENCQYLGITSGIQPATRTSDQVASAASSPDTITLAEADGTSTLTAFVIMPFAERDHRSLPRPLLTNRDNHIVQDARLEPFLDQADDAPVADP